MRFPSPVGVAAGVDKGATWFEGLGALGFGFVEVGTITAEGQPGNQQPRVWRLPADRGLLNAMGFPNPGAKVAAGRLAKRSGGGVVGVNVGKSKRTPLEDAAADYRAAVRELAPFADFVVVNVSSPNTAGLRNLQATDHLRRILDEVRAEFSGPVLVKLSPDLTDEELDEVADTAVAQGVSGIVAVNTTTSRDGLASDPAILDNPGGVSGAPLRPRALEVLRRLYARVGDQITLVSVGGIDSPQDAWERILAGATLVQGYTGFIYGGPLWPKRLNDELARRTRTAGARSIQDLVGTEAPLTAIA
jgi:dihydroorotate dehydrogenase